MNSFFKRTLLFLICAAFSLQGGSYFSAKAKGLGLRVYSTGVRGYGMGATGLASVDSIMVASNTISQWRYLNRTRATIDFFYNRNTLEVGDNNFTTVVGNLLGMNVAIPLKEKKWYMGLTIQPYTSVDFKNSEQVDGDINFTQFNLRSGGVYKSQINVSWSPIPQMGLSLNGNYYFGSIQDNYVFRFDDDSNELLPSDHTIRYRFKGPSAGFSMDLRPVNAIALAGFVDLQANVDLRTVYESQVPVSDEADRNFKAFPLHYGIGSNIMLNKRWNIAVDYSAQKWSETLVTADPEFDDWSHFGVGIERKMLHKRRAGFFNGMDIRAGYSRTQLGYLFNAEPVYQSAVHIGFGIPFTARQNRLDFGLEIGVRGDQEKNLARERFINFQISASIGELWFQKLR